MRNSSKYLLHQLVALLCLALLTMGCDSNNDDFILGNGSQGNLQVQLDVATITPQISGFATRFDISVYDASLNLVGSQTLTTERIANFTGVPTGPVLVRLEAFTAGGARLGFFDRVLNFPAENLAALSTLRHSNAAPAAPAFPTAGAQGFLALDTVPANITGGQAFNFGVTAFNANGTPDNTFTGTATLSANSGTLQTNPGPVNFVAGRATFTGVVYAITNGLTQVQYNVSAAGTNAAVSPTINYIDPSTPTLALVSFPTSPTAQAPFQVEVEALDVGGMRVTNPVDVTLAIEQGPNGAVLGGTTTVTAVNGLATFPGLTLNQAGSYTFRATSNGFTDLVSTPLVIGAALPPQINILTLPNNPQSNTNLEFTAEVIGPDLQRVSTPTNVTLSAGAFPGGSALSGTLTVATNNGVATFNNIQVSQAGNHSFNFNSAGATQVTSSVINVTTGPQPTLTLQNVTATLFEEQNFTLAVDVADPATNPVAAQPVTVAVSSGPGTISGTTTVNSDAGGTATFTGLQVTEPGSYVFSISSAGFATINSPNLTFNSNPTIIIGERIPGGATSTLISFAAEQLTAGVNNIAPASTFTPNDAMNSAVDTNFALEGNTDGSLVWVSKFFGDRIDLYRDVEAGANLNPVRRLLVADTLVGGIFGNISYASTQDILLVDYISGTFVPVGIGIYRNSSTTAGSTGPNLTLTDFEHYRGDSVNAPNANNGFVRSIAFDRNTNSVFVLQARVNAFVDQEYSLIRFNLLNPAIAAADISFTTVNDQLTSITTSHTVDVANSYENIVYVPELDRLFLMRPGAIDFINSPGSLGATTGVQTLTSTMTPLLDPSDLVYDPRANRLYVTDNDATANRIHVFENASAINATASQDAAIIIEGALTQMTRPSGIFLVP